MPAFYRAHVRNFLATPTDQIVGVLSSAVIQGFSGDHSSQLVSWKAQVELLKAALENASQAHPKVLRWGILFEYSLLRLQRRLDVVILAGTLLTVIEFKVGSDSYQPADMHQVDDYALDLRDFHQASHKLSILPVLCVPDAPDHNGGEIPPARPGVSAARSCNRKSLGQLLLMLGAVEGDEQIDLDAWEASPYCPVPTIIEAAELLYAGHEVREIAHASSNPENLNATTDRLIEIIADAHQNHRHIVVFVTGVPGSGKTLVGLNAIHDSRFRQDGRSSGAFLSGNTPLITVLREALAHDKARRTLDRLGAARREVRSEIQGLMQYLQEYLTAHPNDAPVDHVIVFDEAQRAWDAAYGGQKFSRLKSEPALFLEIMDRHPDWAVIVALVGGGQEINRGERGLSEWGVALAERNGNPSKKKWMAVAAPDVLSGGDATAWQSLFEGKETPNWVSGDEKLHLSVSVRSYRCLAITKWVNAVLDGKVLEAIAIAHSAEEFPIYITRSLSDARKWLSDNARGTRRCGLVASSGARRLRGEGLGVSLSATELADVVNWYLRPRGDVRSSLALEVTANEYTCQGLELDYVGMCWDGDMVWDSAVPGWRPRRLAGSKWGDIGKDDGKAWALNKYRVLLTRARIGMVIWVPRGDGEDHTREPQTLDQIFETLCSCGARKL